MSDGVNILTKEKLEALHAEGRLHIPLRAALDALEKSSQQNSPNTFLYGVIEPTKEEIQRMPKYSPPEIIQVLDYIYQIRDKVPPQIMRHEDHENAIIITQRVQALLNINPKFVAFQRRYSGIFITAASALSDKDAYEAFIKRIKAVLTMQVQGVVGKDAARALNSASK